MKFVGPLTSGIAGFHCTMLPKNDKHATNPEQKLFVMYFLTYRIGLGYRVSKKSVFRKFLAISRLLTMDILLN